MYRLLFIDDDEEVLGIYSKHFSNRGYTVCCARSAQDGLHLLEKHSFDCIMLDVMMPGLNGIDACRRIREKTDIPILFLTGRLDEASKVRGLMTGGDDYIAKPCSLIELEARVAANIRRSVLRFQPTKQPLWLRFPPLEVDIAGHQAYCKGESLQLTGREYDILYLLVTHEYQTVTYECIGTQILGTYQERDRRLVMVNISRLRKKLESRHIPAWMIETVWGKGYKFIGRNAHV